MLLIRKPRGHETEWQKSLPGKSKAKKNKTKQKKPTILDETKGRKNTFPVEELRKENAHHALQTMQAGE